MMAQAQERKWQVKAAHEDTDSFLTFDTDSEQCAAAFARALDASPEFAVVTLTAEGSRKQLEFAARRKDG